MIIKNSTYDEFASKIKNENLYIIIYGAGTLGKSVAPYYIEKYNMEDRVLFYVDADCKKQGSSVNVFGRIFQILTPKSILGLDKRFVLLITNSYFYPVVDMYDLVDTMSNVEAYILPIMQLTNSAPKESAVVVMSKNQIIPKVINYCWFSKKPLPSRLQKCIDTWTEFCPDYKIIRWDESNYDVAQNRYLIKAYENKKWAFVSDYARMDILYNYGGIYMDTDVELIRNLDELLYVPAFTSTEKWGVVNAGGCAGAQRGNKIFKQMLLKRLNDFEISDQSFFCIEPSGLYETLPLVELGFTPNNETQVIDDMVVYSSEFFHPMDYITGDIKLGNNTFSIHHFDGGWINSDELVSRSKTQNNYAEILKRIQS